MILLTLLWYMRHWDMRNRSGICLCWTNVEYRHPSQSGWYEMKLAHGLPCHVDSISMQLWCENASMQNRHFTIHAMNDDSNGHRNDHSNDRCPSHTRRGTPPRAWPIYTLRTNRCILQNDNARAWYALDENDFQTSIGDPIETKNSWATLLPRLPAR